MQFARGGRTRYFIQNATPPLPDGGGGGFGSAGSAVGGYVAARGFFNGGMIQRIRARRAGRLAARMGA